MWRTGDVDEVKAMLCWNPHPSTKFSVSPEQTIFSGLFDVKSVIWEMYNMRDSKVIPRPSLLMCRLCSRLGQCPDLARPSVDGPSAQQGYGHSEPPPECSWKALRVQQPSAAPHSSTWGGLRSSAPREPSLQFFIWQSGKRHYLQLLCSQWPQVLSTKLWGRIPFTFH